MGAMGFGGGTITETTNGSAEQELIALQEQVQERYEDTIESLETAVTEVGSIVTTGRVITGRVKEEVADTVTAAKEKTITTLASVQAEAATTRAELMAEARDSLQRLIATAASGLMGIIGTVMAALGFRREDEA